MKKILFFLLILALIPAMMTGCGKTQKAAEPAVDSAKITQNEEIDKSTAGMGDLLSGAYVGMMKNDEYLMKYKATMQFEGQTMDVQSTIAVSGKNTAMISSSNGVESTMIFKDNVVYMVDHANKMVTEWAQTAQDTTGTIDAADMTFVGSGTEEGLAYEEYATSGGSVKYYFKGKDLVKISTKMEGQTVVMEILEMTDQVPASMFEIPAGYQVTKMSGN